MEEKDLLIEKDNIEKALIFYNINIRLLVVPLNIYRIKLIILSCLPLNTAFLNSIYMIK